MSADQEFVKTHPTPDQAFREQLGSWGIELEPDKPRKIQYVFGVPLDYGFDGYPTFDEFRQQYPLDEEAVVTGLYHGSLTGTDFRQLESILGEASIWRIDDQDQLARTDGKPLTIENIRANNADSPALTEQVKAALTDLILPQKLKWGPAMRKLTSGQTLPISVGYRTPDRAETDVSARSKVLYWINGVYVGDVRLTGEPATLGYDRQMGVTKSSTMRLSIRGAIAKDWPWESSGYVAPSVSVADEVDSYLRADILRETPGKILINKNGTLRSG